MALYAIIHTTNSRASKTHMMLCYQTQPIHVAHKEEVWELWSNILFSQSDQRLYNYSKTCVKRPLLKRSKIVYKTNHHLMQVKSVAEMLSTFIKLPFVIKIYVLSIFSGRFTQVLLYRSTFYKPTYYILPCFCK